ncbi:MAG TPA: hypothetical protein VM802_24420 [Chitinophaga sp.]|uniref:immunoglobulin domain-containing protein n=1 Tax=Chitinophaga sp. TaxID=1869181 RepID=UPI002C3876D8|nr:hypothetical protein [Chitinophaga sp.]HVI48036.1 hypothetical protein [Chitinophaga sp.]
MVNPLSTTTYYAEANASGYISLRKAVKVIVNPRPANPDYTVPQRIVCGNGVIVVSNHQSGIDYNVRIKYPLVYTGPFFATSFTVHNTDTIITPNFVNALPSQAEIYIQAVNSATGCKSDSTHKQFVQGGSAQLPNVDADSVTICKGSSITLHAYTTASSLWNIRWYDALVGGNLLYTGNYYAVSPSLTTTYYVTASAFCEYPQRRPVKVIVTKLPDPQYTVPAGYVCGSATILVSNHQAGYNYNVCTKYNSYSGVILDSSFTVINSNTIHTPAFFNVTTSTVDIYVQAINPLTGCKLDSAHMIFTQGPSGAYPSVDVDSATICIGDSVALHAFIPTTTIPSIRWYDAPTGGSLLFTGNYYRVSPAATIIYYVTSANYCEYPQRRPVKVIVNHCLKSGIQLMEEANVSPTIIAKQLKCYPNPTSGNIRFDTDKDLAGSLIIVRGVHGQVVLHEILRKNGVCLPGHAVNGLYFIQIVTSKRGVFSGKVLLQHGYR